MAQTQRVQRIADLLQRELALILQQELRESFVGLLTVTDVDVSPDLSNAKIYVSYLPIDVEKMTAANGNSIIELLQEKARFIRHLLTQRLELRTVPQCRFIYDDSTQKAGHIDTLLERVASK
jgi:ribosome-binding factor A